MRRQVRCQRRQVGLAYLMREAIRGRTGVPGKLTRCDEHLHARQVGLAYLRYGSIRGAIRGHHRTSEGPSEVPSEGPSEVTIGHQRLP